ncbi:SRPBCC family protein [Haladaptatus pallidirubidus]|uniref:SRPBCC family protein n=1 Tax=Haladaptatus pallidirubidus TaxID=1008152 RepID=A0AAV3UBK7_9EURY|nr:SRPBCC family protein [Haladaptatus pallidirubidus]
MSIKSTLLGSEGGTVPDRRSGEASVEKRLASTILGGTLVVVGLKRRSVGGAVATLGGGWLLYRALDGRNGFGRMRELVGAGENYGGAEIPVELTAVERSITVGKPAEELYGFWREPETLARVMAHFADVSSSGPERQHWEVRSPVGALVSWDAEIVEEREGEFLRWESVEGADIQNEGSVRFHEAPGDRGTVVTLSVRFDPPGGALGDAAVRYLRVVPNALAMKSLRRFKSLAETGEIPTLEGNPSARGTGDLV